MKAIGFGIVTIGLMLFQGCDEKDKTPPALTLSIREGTVTMTRIIDPAMDIDTAKFLVIHVFLKRTGEADSVEIQTDPLVVNLDVNGVLTEIDRYDLPAGTYDQITFEIHKPAVDEYYLPDPDFRIGDGDGERFSILANGWRDRIPFHYRSTSSISVSAAIAPMLVIHDSVGTANLTLLVDAASWFADGQGGYLDPDDPGTHDEIQNSIAGSFRAFRDNNRDGFGDD